MRDAVGDALGLVVIGDAEGLTVGNFVTGSIEGEAVACIVVGLNVGAKGGGVVCVIGVDSEVVSLSLGV